MKAWNTSLAKAWVTAGRPLATLSGLAGVMNCTQPSRSWTGTALRALLQPLPGQGLAAAGHAALRPAQQDVLALSSG